MDLSAFGRLKIASGRSIDSESPNFLIDFPLVTIDIKIHKLKSFYRFDKSRSGRKMRDTYI